MTSPRKRRARGGPGAPTLVDVAHAAGVSAMTVSRVINRDPRVLPATLARVEAAISATGYVPNRAARNLARGQSRRIALVYSNPSSAWLSELLMGCLSEAARHDVQLTIEHHEPGAPHAALIGRLRAHGAEAVLLPPPLCDDVALLALLTATGLPKVQIATGCPVPDAHAVTIDNESAAFALTQHLVGLGHRRIAMILGDDNQTASALRHNGYRRALAEAGIPYLPELAAVGDFTYRSGLQAAEALLKRRPAPTAIFASNDDMAAAAITVAHRNGLEVPRELTVCGFDDTAIATTIWPELTTIGQPVAAMARAAIGIAVERLAEQAGGDAPPERVRLDFTLVHRGSEARVP